MKIAMYKKNYPILGTIQRLGVFFNESTLIDVNFLWELYYELKSLANPKMKASVLAPPDLSQLLWIQEEPILFLQETLQIF